MATDTREVRLGDGVLAETPAVYRGCFGDRPAIVVADVHTFEAAGRTVVDAVGAAGIEARPPFIFDEADLHAEWDHLLTLEAAIRAAGAVPIAVGSGTINDLTKLAAHRCGLPYMVVATAASMDGYTAYGASVLYEGSKDTFSCPAPTAVVADTDVLGRAPAELNAAGYGDLIAKTTAAADWLLADAVGAEAIDRTAWSMVQDPLREWLADADGVRRGRRAALAGLIEGLLMAGFAMQCSRSSRAASGAEHQFSHLWDMQHHRHNGRVPLHGCKVGIGTLAVTALFEELLARGLGRVDVERVCVAWPEWAVVERQIRETYADPAVRATALRESRAKYIDRASLARRLGHLVDVWAELAPKLHERLIPSAELRQRLVAAGAPADPGEIGIERERLRRSFVEACQVRRRYTVLDTASETGLLPTCLETLFGPHGPWEGGC